MRRQHWLNRAWVVILVPWLMACGDPSVSTVALPECTDPGVICAWAGTGDAGFDGDHNSLLESDFYFPIDVTFAGDQGPYLVDWNNHKVRSLLIDGTLETVIGTDFIGDGPEDESDQDPPGALGTEVLLNHPTQITPRDAVPSMPTGLCKRSPGLPGKRATTETGRRLGVRPSTFRRVRIPPPRAGWL